MALVVKSIISDRENFELSILKLEGKWRKEPMLSIFPYHPDRKIPTLNEEYIWDNDEYLVKLYKDLKKKKKTERVYELKAFCKKHGMEYKNARKELLDIFKQSKQEKFWNQEI